jgi:predicted house-cleaning noncanonical NTP pyrophosphatase (MazG superfamily)
MERRIFNKLIRDHIPDGIEKNRNYEVVVMSDDEFDLALREKLVEEAQEARQAGVTELIFELADVQEVMQALMELHQITPAQLEYEQRKKHQSRGGFEKRLKLLWVE